MKTLAELEADALKEMAINRAFDHLREELTACPHGYDCGCPDILQIFIDAGRTENCPDCQGTGTLYTHSAAPGSGRLDCGNAKPCAEPSCAPQPCDNCPLGKGQVIS